jgi:DNA-binding response OmpR family regulator
VPKLMIVDDDRLTVSLLKTLLELDDFEVVSVPDGKSAYQKALAEKPDAFLIDFHLADGSGLDLIEKIRTVKEFKTTPIVMASGLNREQEARKVGADRFMIKPFDPGDLVVILNKLLDSAH